MLFLKYFSTLNSSRRVLFQTASALFLLDDFYFLLRKREDTEKGTGSMLLQQAYNSCKFLNFTSVFRVMWYVRLDRSTNSQALWNINYKSVNGNNLELHPLSTTCCIVSWDSRVLYLHACLSTGYSTSDTAPCYSAWKVADDGPST